MLSNFSRDLMFRFRDLSMVMTCWNDGDFLHVSPLIEEASTIFEVTLIPLLLKRVPLLHFCHLASSFLIPDLLHFFFLIISL
jgi:hypothetical protein